MAAEGWAGVELGFVASNGNVTQLYPTYCSAGTAIATATPAQMVRVPTGGELVSLQVETDGTNGGIVQIYDVDGLDAGADISAGTTITNTQLVALIAAGKAKLIYEQNVIGTGLTPPSTGYKRFLKGLAGRFVGAAGSVKLNMSVNGGFYKRHGSV